VPLKKNYSVKILEDNLPWFLEIGTHM